jgi:hypothetical protein
MTWDRRLYFPSEGRHAEDFFALKNPTASARFEPTKLGPKGQHATPRPLKPLSEGLVSDCQSRGMIIIEGQLQYCRTWLMELCHVYFWGNNEYYNDFVTGVQRQLTVNFFRWSSKCRERRTGHDGTSQSAGPISRTECSNVWPWKVHQL